MYCLFKILLYYGAISVSAEKEMNNIWWFTDLGENAPCMTQLINVTRETAHAAPFMLATLISTCL